MDSVHENDLASQSNIAVAPVAATGLAGLIERGILASRYALVPFYLGLGVSLVLLLGKFAQTSFRLIMQTFSDEVDALITGILTLIDMTLVGNLIIIVMFAGYENFVARLPASAQGNRPDWMGQVTYGAIKLKLLTSIIAITAIHILEDFMHVDEVSNREMGWSIGTLVAFAFTGSVLVLMDHFSNDKH